MWPPRVKARVVSECFREEIFHGLPAAPVGVGLKAESLVGVQRHFVRGEGVAGMAVGKDLPVDTGIRQLLRQSVARLKGEKTAAAIRASVKLDFVFVGEGAGEDANRRRYEDSYTVLKAQEDANAQIVRRYEEEVASLRQGVEDERIRASALHDEQDSNLRQLRDNNEWLQTGLDAAITREQASQRNHVAVYNDLTAALVERDALRAGIEDRERRVERAAKSLSLLRDENTSLRRSTFLSSAHNSNGGTSPSRHISPEYHHHHHHGTGSFEADTSYVRTSYATRSAPRPLPTSAHVESTSLPGSRSESLRETYDRSSTSTYHMQGAARSHDPIHVPPMPLPKLADELLRSM